MKTQHTTNKTRSIRRTIWILFALYGAALTFIILFKGSLSFGPLEGFRSVNLVPFRWFPEHIFGSVTFKNIFGNFALFIPFGMFVSLLSERLKFVKSLGLGFALSFAYEALQYIFAIGATDIDDLILNTLGAVAGYLIYCLVRAMTRNPVTRYRAGLVTLIVVSVFSGGLLLFY